MALLHLRDEPRTLTEPAAIAAYLQSVGIQYERWSPDRPLAEDAPADEVLAAYAPQLAALMAQGGYATADLVDLTPATPDLDAMLAQLRREHWHDEDEVRFTIAGRGMFHIHSEHRGVVAVEVTPGDLLRVPRGTHHWFELCSERRMRAIRLFLDPSGWAPHYTETGIDARYQPLCLGPAHA